MVKRSLLTLNCPARHCKFLTVRPSRQSRAKRQGGLHTCRSYGPKPFPTVCSKCREPSFHISHTDSQVQSLRQHRRQVPLEACRLYSYSSLSLAGSSIQASFYVTLTTSRVSLPLGRVQQSHILSLHITKAQIKFGYGSPCEIASPTAASRFASSIPCSGRS